MSPASAAKAARGAGTLGRRSSGRVQRQVDENGRTQTRRKAGVVVEVPADGGDPIVDYTDRPYHGRGSASRIQAADAPEPRTFLTRSTKQVLSPVMLFVDAGPASRVVSVATAIVPVPPSGHFLAPVPARNSQRPTRQRKIEVTVSGANVGVAEDVVAQQAPGPPPGSSGLEQGPPLSQPDKCTRLGALKRGNATKQPARPAKRRVTIVEPSAASVTVSHGRRRYASEIVEGEPVSGSEADMGEYDLTDPFIDDSALEDDQSGEEGDNGDTTLETEGTSEDEYAADRMDHDNGLRNAIQIGLDEAAARDIQSEEEEHALASVVAAETEPEPRAPIALLVDREKGRDKGSTFAPRKNRKRFADVVEENPFDQEGVKSLDDLHTFVITSLPETCEVTNVSLQDPRLKPFYEGLPNLRRGVFESWSDTKGRGMIMFSKWSRMCRDMDFDLCLSAIQFVSFEAFINPSRASPLDVCCKQIIGAKPKYYLYTIDQKPAIFISTVFCDTSHLVDPPERGLVQKWMSGIFHTQEWEQFVGFMCMVFNHEHLAAQLNKDAIQFATKASFGRAQDGSSSTDKFSSMFSNVASPSVKGKGSASTASSDNYTLEHDADIPVYDAQDVEFDFIKDLPRLDFLPRWNGEIPVGSFVAVAYTATVFFAEKTRKWTIGLNIQWAMVIGIPF
ncbi:hypothetical protein BKA70DRAFT_1447935 [Coprinopsis sp. MPI-PUGE-AT-0042]|nr:hypothetical protein BKA70DRAFT_1447935 [Coprinopsis sp. MPI-PUGE-AT-0042]